MLDLKAEVKRTPRRAPAPREYDPEYDQYMHMTGFYVIFHDAMRQQSWRAAGLRATGRVRAPTISYVPPPCAMMFILDLCETLSVEHMVIDTKGASNIIYRVPFRTMDPIYTVCAFQGINRYGFRNARLHRLRGALHVIGALSAEYVEGRAPGSCTTRIEFPLVVWKLQPNGDLRPGTEVTVPAAKYMQVMVSVKEIVRDWPYPDDLHPDMRHWAQLPVVQPVTRLEPLQCGPDGMSGYKEVVDLGDVPLDAVREDARVRKLKNLYDVLKSKLCASEVDNAPELLSSDSD